MFKIILQLCHLSICNFTSIITMKYVVVCNIEYEFWLPVKITCRHAIQSEQLSEFKLIESATADPFGNLAHELEHEDTRWVGSDADRCRGQVFANAG